jgi:hypothetical protein
MMIKMIIIKIIISNATFLDSYQISIFPTGDVISLLVSKSCVFLYYILNGFEKFLNILSTGSNLMILTFSCLIIKYGRYFAH